MQSFKAAARLLAAAALGGALAAAAQAQTAHAAKYEAGAAPDANVKWADVRVEFEGNRLFTSEQLLRATNECYARFDQAAEDFDTDRLDYCLHRGVLAFMWRAGYVRAKLGETRTLPLGAGLLVSVPVEENELYRLGRVNIEGAEHFKAERLRAMLPLREGEIADAVAVIRWREYEDGFHRLNGLELFRADGRFEEVDRDKDVEFRAPKGSGELDLMIHLRERGQERRAAR